MEKLAIDGGQPVRKNKIYYGHQWIDEDDIKVVSETLKSDYITCGPKVIEMEECLKNYTGAKYAVAVSNGTAALHCACIAAGIEPGDEVITTPITFAASANCILYCGATPVFADINPYTYNIDPDKIREKITNKTKAIIAVDYTGQVTEIEKIRAICEEYNLVFIEDAAHSIASKYNENRVGNLADLTTFSFHPVKTITSGEGGAITTNNEEYYRRLCLARTHGITHDKQLMVEDEPEGPWYYEQIMLGFNYRLTDFQAALIISQMKKLDMFVAKRKEIVCKYNEALSDLPELFIQKEIPQSDTCRHLYVLKLNLDRLTCTRREFFDAMSAENVQCQIHYIPVYWFPYYQKLGYQRGLCPKAEEYYRSVISIPIYPKMSDEDVEDVIHAVRKVVNSYSV